MNDNNVPISKAAQVFREVTLEPYNPEHPTFSDRAVRFISEVQNPNLSEAERHADIAQNKPWFQGSWSFFAFMDGHPLLALLPYAGAIRRNIQKRQQQLPPQPPTPLQRLGLSKYLAIILAGLVFFAMLDHLFGS